MGLERFTSYWRKPFRQKIDAVLNRCELVIDTMYERRKGLDFNGYVPPDELIVDGMPSVADASAYEPVSSLACKALIQEAIDIGGEFDNFVDVGCGKGKACIYAAGQYPFRSVVGVDFSLPLVEAARRNGKKSGYPNLTFHHADATAWILPAGRSLVFLYNPFRAPVLEQFLRNNLPSFSERGSMLLYVADAERATLGRLGFEMLYRSHRTVRSIYRRPPSGSP